MVGWQHHQQIDAEILAIAREFECLPLRPPLGGRHCQRSSRGLLHDDPRQLSDFLIAQKIELAIAKGEQADLASARYA